MIAALKHLRSLDLLATELSSDQLRRLPRAVTEKSLFSARTNILAYVGDIKNELNEYLTGDSNLATATLHLQQALDGYGYKPAPEEEGTIKDLRSDGRIKLVLQTNFRQSTNFMKQQAGNEPDALEQFPAWELVRIYPREIPRGEKRGPKGTLVEVPGDDWPSRFREAATAAGDDDALRVLEETGRMIARKDSDLWEELGSPDNFDDAIGTDYPPFAFNSGYGWMPVKRSECVELGLVDEDEQISPAGSEFAAELQRDADSASLADLKATRNALLAAAAKLRGGAA